MSLGDLTKLAHGTAIESTPEQARAARARDKAAGRPCPRCATPLPAGAKACPACHWVVAPPARKAAAHKAAVPRPVAMIPTAPAGSGFAAGCAASILYGLRSFGACFKLILIACLINLLAGLIIFLIALASPASAAGRILVLALWALWCLIVFGYFLRFYLNVIFNTLEGINLPPRLPSFNIIELVATAVKGIGIALVYLFPLITIPLLPLGWLALGDANDSRAFDLIWAGRAAVKRPGRLGLLWLILLAYAVFGTLAVIVLFVLAVPLTTLVFGLILAALNVPPTVAALLLLPLLFLLGVCLFAMLHSVTCACFRCIGLLGYHSAELLNVLPERTSLPRSLGSLAAGAVMTVLVFGFLLPQVLPSLGPDGSAAWSAMLTAGRPAKLRDRAICLSNLNEIGKACTVYATEHGDSFPPDLETLVAAGRLSPGVLVCPATGHASPTYDPDARKLTGQVDYLYLGAGYTTAAWKRMILCHDQPANHGGEGANVLLADGSVLWVRSEELSQELARTRRWQADNPPRRP
ncbi:MAG: hypothetical protein AMJ81_12660 [Phycisphaerae bacterium SM23_33]|nr:MAG: hypothetical protein AMJ81_12660 [Phycisphaerae bacterium SM23_33]